MTSTHSLHVNLPPEAVSFIERKIADGSYRSASEAIQDGIRALLDQDTSLDSWLRDTVVSSFMEYQANPASAVSGDDILSRIHRRAGIDT